jgi:hypothetical protein
MLLYVSSTSSCHNNKIVAMKYRLKKHPHTLAYTALDLYLNIPGYGVHSVSHSIRYA